MVLFLQLRREKTRSTSKSDSSTKTWNQESNKLHCTELTTLSIPLCFHLKASKLVIIWRSSVKSWRLLRTIKGPRWKDIKLKSSLFLMCSRRPFSPWSNSKPTGSITLKTILVLKMSLTSSERSSVSSSHRSQRDSRELKTMSFSLRSVARKSRSQKLNRLLKPSRQLKLEERMYLQTSDTTKTPPLWQLSRVSSWSICHNKSLWKRTETGTRKSNSTDFCLPTSPTSLTTEQTT